MNRTADKSNKNTKKASFISFGSSVVSRIFKGYDVAEKKLFDSYFYKFFSGILRKLSIVKFPVSKKIEESGFSQIAQISVQKLLENNLRYYGVALFFFSIFFTAFSSIREFSVNGAFEYLSSFTINNLLFGIVSLLISIIMMSSKKCVASLMCESSIVSFLMFKVLCFDPLKIQKITYVRRSHTFPVIIGIFFALLAFLISPAVLFYTLLFVLLFTIIFRIPENGVIFLFLALPFLNDNYTFACILIVFVSYLFKVLRCKRVYKAGLFDLSVIFFTVIIFISGIISVNYPESLKSSLAIILFVFFGAVIGNTIRTSMLIEKCVNAIVFSTAFISFLGIIDFALGYFDFSIENVILKDAFNFLNVISFDSWVDFSEFATLILPLSFVKIKTSVKAFDKTVFFLSFISIIAVSALTFNVSVWFSIVFALIVFVLFLRPRFSFGIFCISAVLLVAYVVFPEPFEFLKNLIFRYASTADAAKAPEHFFEVVKNFEFLGIGSGASAPEYVFGCMFGFGNSSAVDFPNSALSFILKYGILGVLSVISMFVIYFMHCTGFCRTDNGYNYKMKLVTTACASSVIAIAFKSLFFNVLLTSEAIFGVFMLVYISLAAKKSAIIEYVPDKTEYPVFDETLL